MEKDIDVVAAGHICFDVIPKFRKTRIMEIGKLLIPGKLINVEEVATSTGGPVSNTGLALHRLGLKVEFMGKVSDDFFGRAILDRLREKVPLKGMKVVKGESSSYTIAIAPPGIDRIFLHNPGTNNTFGYGDVNFDLVSHSRLFHLGYPPLMEKLFKDDGAELTKIYRKAMEVGTTTSLDVSLPDPESPGGKVDWDKILRRTLPYVDIFLPSAEESMYMLDRERFLAMKKKASGRELLEQFKASDLTFLADRCLEYGAKIVAMKCGYKGFYIKTAKKEKLLKIGYAKPNDFDSWAERELWEPPYHVEEFGSATGSGDCAIAGFLSAYLRGETIESALRYACAVGAQNVQVLDAVSGVRSWEETTQQIKAGWKKDKLDIRTPGWRFDKSQKLWIGPDDRS